MMTQLKITDASVSKVSDFGDIIADGVFAGEYTTNLVIPCRKVYAEQAMRCLQAGFAATVELDERGDVNRVFADHVYES